MNSFLKTFLLTVIVNALFIFPVFGQIGADSISEINIFQKFGSVEQSDLQRQSDHDYPFEYLLKESSIRFDERGNSIVAIIDHLVRIKVHSDEPIEVAEASLVGIPFYFADSMERIVNLDGITHQPDGSRSILNQNNIRTVDLNSRYKIIEFEMPDVSQGSVIEYRYRLERRYIEELPDFQFSHRVPTKEAAIYLTNTNYLRFDVVEQNVNFDINYTEQRIDTSNVPRIFTYQRPEPVVIQSWEAEDIPAIDASTYLSSIGDIRAVLKFQISEFGVPRQPLDNSWDFVAAQIQRNNKPFEVVEYNTGLKNAGRQIGEHTGDLKAAQDSVFHLVNSSAQYNEMSSVFVDGPLGHVLEGEPANQAEINMVLLTMLRGAGVDANPLYISGREFGRIDKEFPSLYQFNRMLVVSTIDNKKYFMDASFPHSLPNLIPIESYNEQGMILTENDYEWTDISPEKSLFNFDITIDADLTEQGNLIGRIEAVTTGYPSLRIRRGLAGSRSEAEIIAETFFDVYPEIEIAEHSITVDESNKDNVRLEAAFEIPQYAITFSEGIEFRPMIVGYLFDNPFESTERRAPITLDAPENLTINYRINLPDGFELDVSGETRSTDLQGAQLFEEYLSLSDQLEYSFEIDISRKEFPVDVYSQLRRMYERWVNLSNDTWFIEN